MCYIMTGTSNQTQSIFASGFEFCIKFVLVQNKSLQIMIASKLRKWICMDHLIVNMEMSGWGNLVLNMNITETSDCLYNTGTKKP